MKRWTIDLIIDHRVLCLRYGYASTIIIFIYNNLCAILLSMSLL